VPAHRPANPSTLALQALPFLEDGSASDPRPLLTEAQRQTLEQIGVRVRLPPRLLIYQQDSRADWLFAVVDGVVKSYRELPSGKRAVAAFLFPRDLFGLAEKGRYVNCAKTITRATMYRFPLPALTDLIKRDPELQFQFLVKVTHVLRESQRRAITIARRDAAGRMAMFLVFMQRHPTAGGRDRDIDLPMSRSDIAGFLGLSLEAVIRASAELERRRLVAFEGRHLVHVLDSPRLAKLAGAV
jgi:CRP-like cAMP-binding protein